MNDYSDIIHLPHHNSKVHPRMSLLERAAQFSPFAALSGHNEAILEEARLTSQRIDLDDNIKLDINHQLQILQQSPHPTLARFRYFVPDCNKDGGNYVDYTGYVKKIEPINGEIYLDNGKIIPIIELVAVEILLEP